MAISRFQMNRQLRAYGGIMGQDGRRNYGIGSFFQEKIMDPIKKTFSSDAAKAAAAIGGGILLDKYGIPGTGTGPEDRFGKGVFSNIFRGVSDAIPESVKTGTKDILFGKEKKIIGTDQKGNPIFEGSGIGDTQRTGGLLSGLLTSRVALPIASGLIAGAFTKDKEDPIYTGQDVGLNLQDIAKLANISDPKTASAIGLRFSPDVASRKFTPEEMAATYAANAPRDFTEKREQAQDGGIMGDQKDFEEFLQDMKERDMGAMQDQILRDFQKYMERKRMMENLPEAKDGGIMKMANGGSPNLPLPFFMEGTRPGGQPLPSLDYYDDDFGVRGLMKKRKKKKKKREEKAEGGMMDMGGMEMDLRGGGFVPMGRAEKADDVPARLSKNEFVFTADAVRAAGGGSVDKGADKMYSTMKKLEDRVA